MKMLIRTLKGALLLFWGLSLLLVAGLVVQQYRARTQLAAAAGENKAALRNRYASGGSILDRKGIVLARSSEGERLYHPDPTTAKALLHVVGDYTHRVGNTVEALYQGELTGSNRRFFHQLFVDLRGKGLEGDDITLTIDAALSKKAYQLLDGRRGAVVLLNYETGAVLVSVSSPSTLPENVIHWTEIPDTALYDRALQGAYAPGSIFKILTASAFLSAHPDAESFTVSCEGFSTVAPEGASETGKGHGVVSLEDAFTESCNVYFGALGEKLGKKALLKTAGDFGFGEKLTADRRTVRTSLIETSDSPATLSWLAIGQPNKESRMQISPLQLAMMAGGIANDGIVLEPRFVEHLTNPLDTEYAQGASRVWKTILTATQAGELTALMTAATRTGTASSAAVAGWTLAGKTGTVQVEGRKNTALYVGFVCEKEASLAMAVVVEEGGSGARGAAPLAHALFQAALSE